ncbi:MAG: radical SAM protein [Gammaproteobacteria bacterium]|nr:radical SAM protein [Gammaproteobacteria bacterium]MCP5459607.1 radical SAM protein [Gammaproteobacteria bacterium]
MHDIALIAADRRAFRQAVRLAGPYRLLYAKIKLVWPCNLRCAMCRHWREDTAEPLATAAWLPVLDELAELGCRKLHFSGGEPTLRRDLERLVERATRQGIRVSMTTNATAVTDGRAESLVRAGLRRVNISIDSPDPTLHDRLRGVDGCWSRTVAGFRALRQKLKKGRMRINTVISAANYLSLTALPRWASLLGADALNLIPLDPHTDELQGLNAEQIRDFNATVAPVLAREGIRFGLLADPAQAYPFGCGSHELDESARARYARGYYDRHRCYAPWTHCLIDHAGRVSTCCMTPGKPVLGDLRQESLRTIWTGPAYRRLREHRTPPLLPACRHCDMFLEQNRQLQTLLDGPGWWAPVRRLFLR